MGIIGFRMCFVFWVKFKHVCEARRIPEDSREKIEEHHQKNWEKIQLELKEQNCTVCSLSEG